MAVPWAATRFGPGVGPGQSRRRRTDSGADRILEVFLLHGPHTLECAGRAPAATALWQPDARRIDLYVSSG
ncbi:MAG TPA: hypothetical protein DCE44_05320 [Verrucomicrobiales bacterium]|nr:hypothetical protein [Verrucomicrobiales bacterium]